MTEQQPQGDHRVRTTRISLVLALTLLGGALGWTGVALLAAGGTRISPAPWSAAGGLGFFAALLLVGAWYVYDRVHRKRRRVDPLLAVRLFVLGKASALVGALVAGGYAGFALRYYLEYAVPGERGQAWSGAVAAIAGVVVVVAALLLERACRVPEGDREGPDGEPDEGDPGSGNTH